MLYCSGLVPWASQIFSQGFSASSRGCPQDGKSHFPDYAHIECAKITSRIWTQRITACFHPHYFLGVRVLLVVCHAIYAQTLSHTTASGQRALIYCVCPVPFAHWHPLPESPSSCLIIWSKQALMSPAPSSCELPPPSVAYSSPAPYKYDLPPPCSHVVEAGVCREQGVGQRDLKCHKPRCATRLSGGTCCPVDNTACGAAHESFSEVSQLDGPPTSYFTLVHRGGTPLPK